MSSHDDRVHAAIDRWLRAGLVDSPTAEELHGEVRGQAEARAGRLSQYVLATTGSVVLVIAGGLFVDWAWPVMNAHARTALLAGVGVAVLALGIRVEHARRWLPAALLMQTGAVGLLLTAYLYSEAAWAPASAAGLLVSLAALTTPIVLAGRSMRTNVVMPAVNLAAGLAFLAIFLERSTPLSGDAVIWTLDIVLAGAIAVFVSLLRRDPEGARHPWALNAFLVAMGGGFLLVSATSFEALDLSDESFLALDAWLALCVVVTLWGLHRAPEGLRRAWFERVLALELLGWVGLGALSVYATFDGPPEAFVLLVSGAAVAAFLHADRHRFQELMGAAAIAFLLPIWFWAVDRGGALGGVLALLGTAAFLFWASGRRDRLRAGGPHGVPGEEGAG